MHDTCEAASTSELLLVSPSSTISKCNAGELVASQGKRKVGMIVEKKVKKRAVEGKSTACISRDGNIGDKPDSHRNKQKKNIDETRRVHVNLGRVARTVWKARHGQVLPEIFPFGDSYPNIGIVWTQSVDVANGNPLYTTSLYPPSVLDEYAITLPDSAGVAFPRKRMATNALYWWIICTVPSKQNKINWAKHLLGKHDSSLLVVNQQPWCTLSRDREGSIWIEHKGNKYLLA
jgi:hypothetical protein